MKPAKKALIGNLILFFFTAMSVAWIISGISYRNGPLDGPNLGSLRYYTVDSNILMGIAALAAAVEEGALTMRTAKTSTPAVMARLAAPAPLADKAPTALFSFTFRRQTWLNMYQHSQARR